MKLERGLLSNLDLAVTAQVSGTTIEVGVKIDPRGSFESQLLQLLFGYWRWVAEGKTPHGVSSLTGVKGQYYHDNYHDHIAFENGVYSFNIQTDDSPEGDTWIRGKFKIEPWGEIIVLDQKSYES